MPSSPACVVRGRMASSRKERNESLLSHTLPRYAALALGLFVVTRSPWGSTSTSVAGARAPLPGTPPRESAAQGRSDLRGRGTEVVLWRRRGRLQPRGTGTHQRRPSFHEGREDRPRAGR